MARWSYPHRHAATPIIALVLVTGCATKTVRTAAPAPVTVTALATVTATATVTASPSPTPTPDLASFGPTYLSIIGPANVADHLFYHQMGTLPANATGADFENIALVAVEADQTADQALLRVAWPAAVVADVRALTSADTVVDADLGNGGGQQNSVEAWGRQLNQDVGKQAAAGSIVRADLGLPAINHVDNTEMR